MGKLITSLILEGWVDGITAGIYKQPKVLIQMAKTLMEFLLAAGGMWLISLIAKAVKNIAVEDSIPVIGAIFNAIAAAGMVAEVIQTSAEVIVSPWTYVNHLTLTHDIVVTVYHDPNDPNGFPALATYYELTATINNATPHTSGRIDMPPRHHHGTPGIHLLRGPLRWAHQHLRGILFR